MAGMSRIKIERPDAWDFSTDIPVRITDINYGNHVGNDALVGILHEARMQWLRSLGHASELIAPPVGLIMVDLAIRFKHEAVFGDVLTVRLALKDRTSRGFTLVYDISKAEGREVARAQSGFVFFDYTLKQLADSSVEFVGTRH